MTTEQRRQQIINLVEETGTLNVRQLADRFSVSVVTIRKDLDDLERENLLQSIFGGGYSPIVVGSIDHFWSAPRSIAREKCAIAAAAYNYIKDGDTIMLGAGRPGSHWLSIMRLISSRPSLSRALSLQP